MLHYSSSVDISDVEEWARRCISTALQGDPVEDDLVELKREPIPPAKAARRLAGHANAASANGATTILWLLGIDEKARAIHSIRWSETPYADVGTWWQQVAARFDGEPPTLRACRNIAYDDQTVTALLFAIMHAPYVVILDGPVHRETPWRTATQVRSATKSELALLLNPKQTLTIRALDVTVKFWINEFITVGRGRSRWSEGYDAPPERTSVELGRYVYAECKLLVRGRDATIVRDLTNATLETREGDVPLPELTLNKDRETLHIAAAEVIQVRAEARVKANPLRDPLTLTLTIGSADGTRTTTRIPLTQQDEETFTTRGEVQAEDDLTMY